MNATDSLFSLAVPFGRFLGTRLRLSALMLIVVLAVVYRVQTLTTALLFAAILFLSVCLHEITHLWLTHRMKLFCPDRILWPFGGLFGDAPRRTNALVSLAGPVVNLVLAVVAISQLGSRTEILTLLNPATCWQELASDSMVILALRIVFLVNMVIGCVNMIPIRPLAAGYESDYSDAGHAAADVEDVDDAEMSGSMVERSKNRQESERDLRERQLQQREHHELDCVLEKLHTQGRKALSIAELHLLNRVSARRRQKNH